MKEILYWAMLQRNGLQKDNSRFMMRELIKKKIQFFADELEKKEIKIITELVMQDNVEADYQQIAFVVRNILRNAIKFSYVGGQIKICTEQYQSCLKISIIDNGVGMTVEQQRNLFTNQVIKSTDGTKGEKGSGLGLRISKEFIVDNEGEIWIESKKNSGTTVLFTCRLATTQGNKIE
jgi:signal transduction histidine kinase